MFGNGYVSGRMFGDDLFRGRSDPCLFRKWERLKFLIRTFKVPHETRVEEGNVLELRLMPGARRVASGVLERYARKAALKNDGRV